MDDDPAAVFERHRALLGGVAYRVLGSISDAEDVVQETWLRWSAADRSEVRDPRAFLTTTTSRLALNALRARRSRRETYPGPWLPEPVLTEDAPAGGEQFVLLAESVSMAFLVVLESLSPLERVAFVMHDVFGFEHAEVAAATGRSEPAVRQLSSRARRRVRERRPQASAADPAEHERVLRAFMRAAVDGDVTGLLGVLAPDVAVVTDGGGVVKAARREVTGADKAARFLQAISGDVPGVRWSTARLNGRTGVLVMLGDDLIGTVDIDVAEGLVTVVRAQINPEKLAGARRPGSAPWH